MRWTTQELWYFDSGCSRHMTGMKENLQDVKQLKGGKVTFGCGTKGTIQGKGRTSEEQPQLMNVYLVQGLKSNLISVSQLCDEGLTVWFNKLECKAIDADGKAVLRGVSFRQQLLHVGSICKMPKCAR
ncbi:unnamed protein product [Microthlaspi erraticum]|uniref:Retrovirus-related Pol polyprotein from transposon TNT 1-94-like beta-barrel domain-containing protein n=1 Tax=Microthlaspi erraticum TaxID=1685480 RepID=A0A6D2JP73_9BRAS|nr:unnamed protein product [Microthlaspi erraticum]